MGITGSFHVSSDVASVIFAFYFGVTLSIDVRFCEGSDGCERACVCVPVDASLLDIWDAMQSVMDIRFSGTRTPWFSIKSSQDLNARMQPHPKAFTEGEHADELFTRPGFAKLLYSGVDPFRRWRNEQPDTYRIPNSQTPVRKLALSVDSQISPFMRFVLDNYDREELGFRFRDWHSPIVYQNLYYQDLPFRMFAYETVDYFNDIDAYHASLRERAQRRVVEHQASALHRHYERPVHSAKGPAGKRAFKYSKKGKLAHKTYRSRRSKKTHGYHRW